ncbi:MAG: hypothetical protein HZA02_10010 [Nitrospinae bacterium]|nr:hypothetical protein [Nitrospinota bacterium]
MQDPSFPRDQGPKKAIALVATVSGLSGFVIGVAYVTWHPFITSGQVLAGLVEYPRDNPYYLYHLKIWTLLHQLGAFFLSLGVSEKTLTVLFSGLLGLISFQALSLSVLALNGNVSLSLGTPFFVFFTEATKFGINYPLELLGYYHSNGTIGRGLALLAIALLSLGKYGVGGFIMGIVPSIHAAWGGFLWLFLLLALVWDFKRFFAPFKKTVPSFLMGCALCGASLAYHRLSQELPPADLQSAAKIVEAYLLNGWDFHRSPVNLLSVNFILGVFSLTIAFFGAVFLKDDVWRDTSQLFLKVLTVSGVFGAIAALLSHLPAEWTPRIFMQLMPTRALNLNIQSLMPLLIGLLAYDKKRGRLTEYNLAGTLLALCLVLWLHPPYWGRMMALILFVSILLFMAETKIAPALGKRMVQGAGERPSPKWPRGVTLVVLGLCLLGSGVKAYSVWEPRHAALRNWGNDPFLAAIASGKGMLLPGVIDDPTQLLTHRPILMGPLNALPYVPEAGPQTHKILKEVYGLDLFNPPEEARKSKAYPDKTVKAYWESLTPAQWHEIKEKFAVTDILTYAYWKLQLPGARLSNWGENPPAELSKDQEYVYYHIP